MSRQTNVVVDETVNAQITDFGLAMSHQGAVAVDSDQVDKSQPAMPIFEQVDKSQPATPIFEQVDKSQPVMPIFEDTFNKASDILSFWRLVTEVRHGWRTMP